MMVKVHKYFRYVLILTVLILGYSTAEAQQNTAQQAYAIFQQNCLGCHGEHGPFREALVIDSAAGLIQSGAVVPGQLPINSELYTRLLEKDDAKRMPLNQPKLSPEAILTIGNWILAGAPSWDAQHDVSFITTDAMLTAIQNHLSDLDAFNRPYARYFTTTHLYNAGEGPETLRAAEVALSKLVNSLSWNFDIVKPLPIDAQQTIFYIDLRDYDWDGRGAWTQIEEAYPYTIAFDSVTHPRLHEKLIGLLGETQSEVPFVQADWFLATASLPPLYHDILGLPETDRELEQELRIDVNRNLQQAPGRSVWRAGTNDSGVSRHNRVVERHKSPYGAYWKSYDFAGSSDVQNIFTRPLSFQHDGGEVIFNLPNGLQAYYISDGQGNRIDVAPTEIVSNPAASDPAVRNGLSCIGCHTEGMKTFEDGVRATIEKTARPAYDKAHALRLYVKQPEMDALVAQDKQHYVAALEKTGGVSGGIEPVHLFHEAFQGPLTAPHAAAAIGMETETFLAKIRREPSLQNLGLAGLLSGGNVKRDVWESNFSELVVCVYGDECVAPVIETPTPTPTPVFGHPIPDENLRAAIAERLGKAPALLTTEDIAKLTRLEADERGISDLRGLEHATRLERIELRRNAISDLSPLAGLTRLNNIKLRGNQITDVSPLAKLINVEWMGLEENQITDVSPLKGLVKLNGIGIGGNPVSNVSPLAGLLSLEGIDALHTDISNFAPLAKLPRLQWLEFGDNASISELPSLKGLKTLRRLVIRDTRISDVSGLEGLVSLTELNLERNVISDVSPLAKLTRLKRLELNGNVISDVSPLAGLTNLEHLNLQNNAISDFSPLDGLPEKTIIRMEGNSGSFIRGAPKIEGPWLWVIAPTGGRGGSGAARSGVDFLAQMSNGNVTELKVATNGAIEGNPVGDTQWTLHKLSPTGGNNLNDMANEAGLGAGDINDHVAYGSIALGSPRAQKTRMLVGSDDAVKVWLNGELVHNNPVDRGAGDFQDQFSVTLKKGINTLLVAVYERGGGWSGFFGFASGTEYTVLSHNERFSLSTNPTQIEKGDTFTLRLTTANITDLAGWQSDIVFDPALLKANSVTEGSFLKQSGGRTFFQKGTINNTKGKITGIKAARTSIGGAKGEGILLSVRFTAIANGRGRIVLRDFRAGSSAGKTISATPPETMIVVERSAPTVPAWDVNADGITNATDVQLVTGALGQKPPKNPRLDVNGDGVVDGKDLALVAEHLGEKAAPAAPVSANTRSQPQTFTYQIIERSLNILRAADDGSLTFQRGIANLEQLLALFIPEETALLHNYPNPFNPETWIPYRLTESANVTIRIYAASGVLVRTLALGYQPTGIYQYRSRAAYWDGKNEVGESVASGIYFYTLTAGDFTATRKMLIRK